MTLVIQGENDLYTTHPELVNLLLNPEEAHTISFNSHKRTDFKCDYCGSIVRDCIVRNVFRYGLRCPICSDNMSFGEKIMANILTQLGLEFKYDKTTSWSNDRRYDFIIESHSIIIETHGIQHYRNTPFHKDAKSFEEEIKNDEYKKQLAIDNNVSHYIVINTSKYSYDFIKQSILDSELNTLFDLSNIDWREAFISTHTSKVQEVCNLWNSGIRSTSKISEIVGLHHTTVREYLNRCSRVGLCDYTSDRHKKIICVDTGKIYDSLEDVGKDGFNMSQVSACCHNKAKTSGGYNWCFLKDYDSDTYVMKISNGSGMTKKVLWIEKQVIYEKLIDVKMDGFNPSSVSRCCNGKIEHCKQQHFKFI